MRLWPRKRVYVDELPQTHDARFATIFMLGFLVLLGGVYLVGYFAAGDRLPTGTTVDGIDVGGMKSGEARTVLQSKLSPRLERPVTAEVLGKKFTFNPQQIGLTYDLDATITNGLGGGSWDPRHMWNVVSGGDKIDPVIDIDQRDLTHALDRVARKVDQPAVDAKVSFRGGVAIEPGHAGVALDYAASRRRLSGLLTRDVKTVDLVVRSVATQVSTTEAQDFVTKVAKPAVAKPVRISVADTTLRLAPREFVPALRATAKGTRLTLDADADALFALTKERIASLPHKAHDARLAFQGGRPVVVPGRSGATVDAAEWAKALLRALDSRSRSAEADVTAVEPGFSTGDARHLAIKEPVATVAVQLDSSIDEGAMDAAARALSGTLVMPRDEFSFLAAVPVDAPAADSLLASATYQAAVEAGMSEFQRTASAHISGLLDDGFDSQVASPGPDLAWRNNTPYGVYVRSLVRPGGGGDPATLRVELWSSRFASVKISTSSRYSVIQPRTKRDSTSGCQPHAGVPGFDYDVTRELAGGQSDGQVETFHSHYTPRRAVVCR